MPTVSNLTYPSFTPAKRAQIDQETPSPKYGAAILRKRTSFSKAFKIDIGKTWNGKVSRHQRSAFLGTMKKILLVSGKVLTSPLRTQIVKLHLDRPYTNLNHPDRFAKLILYFHNQGLNPKELLENRMAGIDGKLQSKALEFQTLFEKSKCYLLDLISEFDTQRETPEFLSELCQAFTLYISTAQKKLFHRSRTLACKIVEKESPIDPITEGVVKLMYDEMMKTIEIGRKASVRIREKLNGVSPRRPRAAAALEYQFESLKKLVKFFKRENSTICQELLEMLSERHPEFRLIQGDESLAAIKNMEEKFKNIWKSHNRAARSEISKLENRLLNEELQAARKRMAETNEKESFLELFRRELSFIHDTNTLIYQNPANDLREEKYPLEEIETRFAKSWYASRDLPDWLVELNKNGASIEDQIEFIVDLEEKLTKAFGKQEGERSKTLEKNLPTARRSKMILLKKLRKTKQNCRKMYGIFEGFMASSDLRAAYKKEFLEQVEIDYISSIQNLIPIKNRGSTKKIFSEETQFEQDLTLSAQDIRSFLKITLGDGSRENPGSPTITSALLEALKEEHLASLGIEVFICENLDLEIKIFEKKRQEKSNTRIRSKPILIEENGQKSIVVLKKFEPSIRALREHLLKKGRD